MLACSFGLYGLLKKQAPLAALPGLTLETGLLWLPAVAYLLGTGGGWSGGLRTGSWSTGLLLGLSGVVTGLPLLLFAAATRRIRLATVGLLQYLAPSGQLLIGVAVYHEPFGLTQWIGFLLIWGALGLYSAEHLLWKRRLTLSSEGLGRLP